MGGLYEEFSGQPEVVRDTYCEVKVIDASCGIIGMFNGEFDAWVLCVEVRHEAIKLVKTLPFVQ